MAVLASVLLQMLLVILRKIATQAMFEYVLLAVLDAGAKHTATDWDDKLVAQIKQALAKPE